MERPRLNVVDMHRCAATFGRGATTLTSVAVHRQRSAVVLNVRRVLRAITNVVGWTRDIDEDYGSQIDWRDDQVHV
jgi:hypothetical protein